MSDSNREKKIREYLEEIRLAGKEDNPDQTDLNVVFEYHTALMTFLEHGKTRDHQDQVAFLLTALVNVTYLVGFLSEQGLKSLLSYNPKNVLDILLFLIGRRGLQIKAINALRRYEKARAETNIILNRFKGDDDPEVRACAEAALEGRDLDENHSDDGFESG